MQAFKNKFSCAKEVYKIAIKGLWIGRLEEEFVRGVSGAHVTGWWVPPCYRVERIHHTSWSKKLHGFLVPQDHENIVSETFLKFGAGP